MASKIVGWLVGDWDGKISDCKKNLKEKKIFWNKSEKGESYIFAAAGPFKNKLSNGYDNTVFILSLKKRQCT